MPFCPPVYADVIGVDGRARLRSMFNREDDDITMVSPCRRIDITIDSDDSSNVIRIRFGADNDSSRLPGAEKSRQMAGIVALPSECRVKGGEGGCRVSRKKRDWYTINSQICEKLCPITPCRSALITPDISISVHGARGRLDQAR